MTRGVQHQECARQNLRLLVVERRRQPSALCLLLAHELAQDVALLLDATREQADRPNDARPYQERGGRSDAAFDHPEHRRADQRQRDPVDRPEDHGHRPRDCSRDGAWKTCLQRGGRQGNQPDQADLRDEREPDAKHAIACEC